MPSIRKTAARLYSDGHLWLEPSEDGYYVGLTQLALEELGEINFIELPTVGAVIHKDDVLFVLESNKASGDFVSAVDGVVAEVNQKLAKNLQPLNASPEEMGWLCKLTQVSHQQLQELMSSAQYEKAVNAEVIAKK